MALRERNDWTDEGLVPRALAIHSSLLPSSTQRRMSSTNSRREIRCFIPITHRLYLIVWCPSVHLFSANFQYFTTYKVDWCHGGRARRSGVRAAAGADDPG